MDHGAAPAETAHAAAVPRARRPVRQTLRVLSLAAVGALFFVFHGLSLHLNPWSQAFVNAIVKYVYPTTGQQDATVLLFREENIRDLGTQYPVPHGFHAQVLEALASYGPRAVFIDFAFIDPRQAEQTEELAAAICALAASRPGGTEVFLAAPHAARDGGGVLPALLRCAKPVSPAIADFQGVSGVLTYAAGAGQAPHFVPSAAFATARALAHVDPAGADGLEIIWGNGVAPLNHKWMGCHEHGAFESAKEVLLHGPLALKKNCPYTRTLTVGHVMQSSGDRDIEDALKDRTVFYGGAFEFTGDRISSPVYAELPGVYLHAMAHDNLVTFGAHYKRSEHAAGLLDTLVLLVTSALLVLLPRGKPWIPGSARLRQREDSWLHRLLVRIGAEPKEVATREQFLRRLVATGAGVALAAGVLALTFHLGGIEAALWALLLTYLAYRLVVPQDAGFAIFLAVMLVTGLVAYFWLDLGPRNVLAYFAFFEVVRHLQHRMAEAHHHWMSLGRASTAPQSRFHSTIDSILSLYGPDDAHPSTAPAAHHPPTDRGAA